MGVMRVPLPSFLIFLSTSTAFLLDELASIRFLNEGVHVAADSSKLLLLPVNQEDTEPENITINPYTWLPQGPWAFYGQAMYLFLNASASGGGACSPLPAQPDMDRHGGDFSALPPAPPASPAACASLCCADARCDAWVFSPSAPTAYFNCSAGAPCCYLKCGAPAPSPNPGVTTGAVNRTGAPLPVPPPLGLRSAVPLGGVGAGALELRGDGTVHEVTIVNQSPAGSAKYGVVADMVVGAAVGSSGARALRTAPPPYAEGVSSITYSGSHPVSRLSLGAPLRGADLFAFSPLVPGDMAASATPAIAFSLRVDNANGSAPVNATLFLSLPFAAVGDCFRNGTETGVVAALALGGYSACLAACRGHAQCASWSYLPAPPPSPTCFLNRFLVHSAHLAGAFCGVPGGWSWNPGPGGGLTLSMAPPGYAPSTARGNRSAGVGDITLLPVMDDGAGGGAASVVGVDAGVGDSPAALWAAFAGTRGFAGAPGVAAGAGGGPFFNATGAHGAVALTVAVPAGRAAVVSLVLAWSFPDRTHCGKGSGGGPNGCNCRHGDNGCCGAPDPDTLVVCEEVLGNFYANLFADSAAAARALGDPAALRGTAGALNAHHSVFSSPASSLPEWLQDAAVNQASHYRSLMFFRDGRARQWEAMDCPDIDSVHNDYQRHLLYLWLMPAFEVSKMRAWGEGQDPDGHIAENIASFSLGPIDEPGGRVMGDTSSVFVLELFELHAHTGDDALLAELYPSAARALAWMAGNAAPLGLPLHLVCTYDMLGLEAHNVTTYNSFLYLAAMRAGGALAARVGDNATAALAGAAFLRGQASLLGLLWAPDGAGGGFFRAFQGGAPGNESAVMADCLYGQMVALQLGLGWLVPPTYVAAHLPVELGNLNRFGLRVMSDPRAAPSGDTNWMNGVATWSYLSLALLREGGGGALAPPPAAALAAALEPTRRTAENYRTRLNDLWDLHGLTTGENPGDGENEVGQPFVTSHYGFFLTSYFLLGALSGQQTDLPGGALNFAPLFLCPFELPLLLAGTTGTVACDAGGAFTARVAFGRLTLPAGGLAVNGRRYAGALDLGPGESVTW